MAEGSSVVAPLSIITSQPELAVVRVHIAGEIDLAAAGQLRAALAATYAAAVPGTAIRMDLAGVTFIDAYGVGVLVRSRQAAQEAGLDFSVHNARGIVRRIFDVLGMGDLLGTAPT